MRLFFNEETRAKLSKAPKIDEESKVSEVVKQVDTITSSSQTTTDTDAPKKKKKKNKKKKKAGVEETKE